MPVDPLTSEERTVRKMYAAGEFDYDTLTKTQLGTAPAHRQPACHHRRPPRLRRASVLCGWVSSWTAHGLVLFGFHTAQARRSAL